MKIFNTLLWIVIGFLMTATAYSQNFESEAERFVGSSRSELIKAIDSMATVDDPRVLTALKALLQAQLYYQKSNKQIFIVSEDSGETSVTDLFTGQLKDSVNPDNLKKIRITNKVRRTLKRNIAIIELKSKDSEVRLSAAKNFASTPNEELRDEIIAAIAVEESNSVLEYLNLALGLIDIYSDDQALRMDAAKALSQTVQPQAVAILNSLAAKSEDGSYVEENVELAKYAEKALGSVNSRLRFFELSESLLYGVSLGSILLLAAIGLAITFGVMGVINMAHGEMIMLGAYTTFAVQQFFPNILNYSLLIAVPAAFLVSGAMGVLIERLVIRHLYGRPLDTLLATFGVSLILQQLVRTGYSSNNVSVATPDWASGFWQLNGAVSLTYNRIYILMFSLLVLAMLALLLKKTLVGLQMRAVTQNRGMANSMGIKSSWVDAMTFGLGSGIAGIAGVALSQITSVGPNLGQTLIVDSFMVVVFGGVGNIMGTFWGALILGVSNKFMEPYTGAVIAKILILVFIILFIQWRPRGLFALKGRFVED
ncbi:MAG: urea ABC transporter permease subunit UrtB [Pseudomonadales bacterium]|nr:urea ABC transporter permease subunit UrtB [Pseudomonadales bacterium]